MRAATIMKHRLLAVALVMVTLAGCGQTQTSAPPTSSTQATATASASTPASSPADPSACNAAGDALVAAIPADQRAAYLCTDPAKVSLEVYAAVDDDAALQALQQQLDPIASKHTAQFTLIRVDHSEAEIIAKQNLDDWPKQARERLLPGLIGTAFDIPNNALLITALTSTTWTEAEASKLLGIRVTRRTFDTYPSIPNR